LIFADPGSGYLQSLGELVYAVTSLEGLMIFDIPRMQSAVPAKFTVDSLVGGTTAGIGQQFLDCAPKVTDAGVRAYFETGGAALREVGGIRNNVLHARPATMDTGAQRLYRHVPGTSPVFIDDDWLETALNRVADLSGEVTTLRPSFTTWPAT
jgi:hypothetical protein